MGWWEVICIRVLQRCLKGIPLREKLARREVCTEWKSMVTRAKVGVYLRNKIIQKISCECCFVLILQRFCMPFWVQLLPTKPRGINCSRVTAFLTVVVRTLYCVMGCLSCYCCQCPSPRWTSPIDLPTAAHFTLLAYSAISIDGNFKKKTSCKATLPCRPLSNLHYKNDTVPFDIAHDAFLIFFFFLAWNNSSFRAQRGGGSGTLGTLPWLRHWRTSTLFHSRRSDCSFLNSLRP